MNMNIILALLFVVGCVNATRFISKEAEDKYYAGLQSSFSIPQANISAYLSAAAYCGKDKYKTMVLDGPASGFEVKSIIYDSKTDNQGYIGVLPSDKSIYVVYRGSSSIKNWIVNVDAIKTDYTSFSECNCQVHKGWYAAEQNVILDVIQQVQNLQNSYPDYDVKVTGHSLGAALAQLTTMDLAKSGIQSSIIDFGQPRTGDANYASFVPSIVSTGKTWRVTHDKDVVVHLPPTVDNKEDMSYKHICTEEFENGSGNFKTCDSSCEDPSCSDQYDLAETNVDDHCSYLDGFQICDCESATK